MKSSSKKVAKRRSSNQPPWKRADPKPKPTRKRLSAADKTKARARAAKAGRPYPNLVDNMAVARTVKS
jgi:hypothetical protein